MGNEQQRQVEREIEALLEELGYVEVAPQTWADRAPSLRFFLNPDWRPAENEPAETMSVEISWKNSGNSLKK